MRWFFVYRGRATPSGGHKQIRLMVYLLRELGVDACLLLDGRTYDDALYDVSVPKATFDFHSARRHLLQEDVLVFPESRMSEYLELTRFWRCRKAVNNQNAFFALKNCPRAAERVADVEFAIANTRFIASLSEKLFHLESNRIFYIPCWVARRPFESAAGFDRRELAICYMPRKLPDHALQVRRAVEGVRPDIPWVEIDGVPETEVARRFSTHALFLSTQDREGLGLPALEAMACGCVVGGYPGTWIFPHPYAKRSNGFWSPDRSVRDAASALMRAIRVVEEDGVKYRQTVQSGFDTVRAYRKESVVNALAEMAETVAGRKYESRRVQVSKLSLRCHLGMHRVVLNDRVAALTSRAGSSLSRFMRW